MKKILAIMTVITFLTFVACSSSPPKSNAVTTSVTTTIPRKISLDDAPDILDISLLLPSRYIEVDAASEKMSNKDMGLGSDFSEVQLYISDDPFQMIYGFMGIITSRLDAAIFDKQLRDESYIKDLIRESILEGAKSEGGQVTVPNLEATYPSIGDLAIWGVGDLESYGYYFGFSALFFRVNKVYVFLYSLSMTKDEVSLKLIAEEIEKRIGQFSQ